MKGVARGAHFRDTPADVRPGLGVRKLRTPSAATNSRALAAIVDQAASSLQNYAILLAGLHLLSIPIFGEFSLVYTSVPIVITIARAWLLTPFTVGFTTASGRERRTAIKGVCGSCLGVGLGLLCLCFVTAGLVNNKTAKGLIVSVGILMPFALFQDACRMYLFASKRGWSAAVNDGISLGTTGLVLLLWQGEIAVHPYLLIAAWTIGTAAGSIVGLRQLGTMPSLWKPIGRLRRTRRLGLYLSGGQLVEQSVGQLAYASVGILATAKAVGVLGTGRAVFAPVTMVLTAISIFGLPEAVSLLRLGSTKFNRLVVLLSVLCPFLFVAYGGLLLAIPNAWTMGLFGKGVASASALLVPVAVWYAAVAGRQGVSIGLYALGRGRVVFWGCVGTSILVLGVVPYSALRWGALGAAWAYALAYGVSTPGWWLAYRHCLRTV